MNVYKQAEPPSFATEMKLKKITSLARLLFILQHSSDKKPCGFRDFCFYTEWNEKRSSRNQLKHCTVIKSTTGQHNKPC